MNQIVILVLVLILLVITFLVSRKEQVSKAKSNQESRKTEKESWSQEKVMEYGEIQSQKEALLKAVEEKFAGDPGNANALKEMIEEWADMKIKVFSDRRSWVRNPDKDKD